MSSFVILLFANPYLPTKKKLLFFSFCLSDFSCQVTCCETLEVVYQPLGLRVMCFVCQNLLSVTENCFFFFLFCFCLDFSCQVTCCETLEVVHQPLELRVMCFVCQNRLSGAENFFFLFSFWWISLVKLHVVRGWKLFTNVSNEELRSLFAPNRGGGGQNSNFFL